MAKKTRKKTARRKKPSRLGKLKAITLMNSMSLQNALDTMKDEFDRKLKAITRQQVSSDFLWTTAVGDRIPVTQMDEQHLRNTISYLQRTITFKFGRVAYLSEVKPSLVALVAMLDEAQRRGFRV